MKIYVKGFLNFILFETKKMMEPGIMKMYRIGLIIFFGFFFHFKMFFSLKFFYRFSQETGIIGKTVYFHLCLHYL